MKKITEKQKQKRREQAAQWRAANYEKIQEYNKKKLYRNNPQFKNRVDKRKAQVKETTVHIVSFDEILKRDGMFCYICEKDIESNQTLHFDHIIPLSRGGAHTKENIKPTHGSCNTWKYNWLISELKGKHRPEPSEMDEYVKQLRKQKISEIMKNVIANKTPEEIAAWGAAISAAKQGSEGNIENLKKGWTLEVRAKAIANARETNLGSKHTEDHKENISDGLKKAYEEGRRIASPRSEDTKKKISESKKGKGPTPEEVWAKHGGACLNCKTSDRPHKGNGLCAKCWQIERKNKLKEQNYDFIKESWKNKSPCLRCGKTDSEYKSKGVCNRCYQKSRKNNINNQ